MTKSRDFLGPYRLARLIRAGNSCEVWEAVEEPSLKRFALKVLRQKVRDNKVEVASLKFEYTVAKDMTSPRIIKVLEYRIENGTPFLVMEPSPAGWPGGAAASTRCFHSVLFPAPAPRAGGHQ